MAVTAEESKLLTLQEASQQYGIAIPTLRMWRRLSYLTLYERGDGRAMVDPAEIEKRLASRQEVRKVNKEPEEK